MLLAALLTTTAAAVHAAGPAQPVEPVVIQPAPVASPFWAGGYVGGQLGYSYGEFDLGNASVNDFDDDNLIGGIHPAISGKSAPASIWAPSSSMTGPISR